MKDWPGGSYFVMNSNPRFPCEMPLQAIDYKYNSRNVLVFIDSEGAGSAEPGDPYLSFLSYIYSNFFVRPVALTHLLGRYFNTFNSMENHNRMRHSDTAIDKYGVTQSGYFILATKVVLVMSITFGNLLYCHGVAETNMENKISALDYNNRTVYDCFKNPFIVDFGKPILASTSHNH